MNTLIGFAGYKESGKDSAASFAIEEHGFTRVAFADVIKRVAENINPYVVYEDNHPVHLCDYLEWIGWDWEAAKKNHSIRQFLNNLGIAIRNEDSDFWLRAAGVFQALEEGDVVVTDVRFPNELAYIENLGGTVVRVTRPGKVGDPALATEVALDGYVLPELENDGTLEDLGHRVSALVSSLRGLAS
jgi:hypothetical protein